MSDNNETFDGFDEEMLRLAVLQDPPERIEGIPDYINDALLKALSKDRRNRFSSCVEFVNRLSEGIKPVNQKRVWQKGASTTAEEYRKAAEEGDAEAQNILGDCYDKGKGVLQNYEEAVNWYRLAAGQGNANAQEMLKRFNTN